MPEVSGTPRRFCPRAQASDASQCYEGIKENKVKKAAWLVFPLMLLMTFSAFAKDKEYQDGTIISVERWHPTASQAMQAVAGGYTFRAEWVFKIQVGDWAYEAGVVKKWKGVSEAEWPANSKVQVRFDIKGGALATQTTLHIRRDDGKEIEGQVVSITDQQGREYCGRIKCDPKNAEKKYNKEMAAGQ